MLVGWVHLDTSLARGGDRLREECGDKFPDLSESLFIVDMRHEWAEACALLDDVKQETTRCDAMRSGSQYSLEAARVSLEGTVRVLIAARLVRDWI